MWIFSSAREARLRADRLEPLLPPALLGRLGDVHVLGADRAAVGLAQRLHDLAQRHLLGGREVGVRRAEHHVHVGFAEVVERRLELGDLRALLALQRIEVGPARAERAVGGDQRLDVDLLPARSPGPRSRRGCRRRWPWRAGRTIRRPAHAPCRVPTSRRWRGRSAARRSTRATCRERSRGCRGRPRTAPRRTARCRRTGTSSPCFPASFRSPFVPVSEHCSGLSKPSALRLRRVTD